MSTADASPDLIQEDLTQLEKSSTGSRIFYILLLIAASWLIVFLLNNSLSDNTRSDPKLTLVVSQALVDQGTIALTDYQDSTIYGRTLDWYANMGDVVTNESGDYYNYFPLGPSLMSVPFVKLARLQGLDMRTNDNSRLQIQMAIGSVIMTLLLLVAIGRFFTSFLPSFIIASITVFGSTIISTMGTGLWTHNFTVLLSLTALYLTLSINQHLVTQKLAATQTKTPIYLAAMLIGVFLFLAFLTRASIAALILPIFAYLFWREWRLGLMASATAGFLFGLFLLWSNQTFGTWLPPYYSTGRLLVERQPTWVGVYGNLLSPSRGIFVFSPFLVFVPLGLLLLGRRLANKAFVMLLLTWFVLNLVLVSRAAKWWGGWSYGPRVLTDIIPALSILLFMLWQVMQERIATIKRRSLISGLVMVLFIALGAGGIWINSYQGLRNQAAMRWYNYILATPEYHTAHPLGDMFRWDYAQFLATDKSVCGIELDKARTYLDAPLPLGADKLLLDEWLDYREENTLNHRIVLYPQNHEPKPFLVGFTGSDPSYRWTACPEAIVAFDLQNLPSDFEQFKLDISVLAIVKQPVTVYFNDILLQDAVVWDDEIARAGQISFDLNKADVNSGQRNVVRFEFPEVAWPNDEDRRLLGFGFGGLRIRPSFEPQ